MSRARTPSRRPWLLWGGAVLALAAVGFGLWMRGRSATGRGSWRGASVLFVTIDTLRTDGLGAYGGTQAKTPAIDALAARATVFERAYSTTPLTLPSHTTIFSGTYPMHHGVRDNGGFVVPKDLPLLAELFRAKGYATAAYVAAFVLDSRWGLNRGFDTYHDDFDTRKANLVSIGDIERPAVEVVDEALKWLERRDAEKPFFLWVHLFDCHAPYVPPPPFAAEYAERPYYGEVAYVDSQLARLLAKLPEGTGIVLAGDHGESLGEHDERGHGMFVYQETQHVPLIVIAPRAAAGSRRSEVVSLADVMPTVAELAGFSVPAGVQGQSLVPLMAGAGAGAWKEQSAYSETFYPYFHFGWSPLAALQTGQTKLIDSSDPELFDLAKDPRESKNLFADDHAVYLDARRRLVRLVEAWGKEPLSARKGSEDPEAARKLASLGYLSGGPAPTGAAPSNLPSPRSRIALYNRLNSARSVTARAEFDAAEKELRAVLAEDPGIIDARTALASILLKQGRTSEALPFLAQAVAERRADVSLVMSLALAQSRAGRPGDARATIERAMAGGLDDSRFAVFLGALAEARGDRAEADRWNARAVSAQPTSASLASALAETRLDRKDFEGAQREADRALSLDPKVLGAHWVRGKLRERGGDAGAAFDEFGQEVAVNAVDERAFADLSRLAAELRASDRALVLFEDAIERHPDHALPYLYVARNLLQGGEHLDRALEAAQRALDRAGSPREEAFACFLLADLYSRLGDPTRSREFAQRGREAAANTPS